MLAPRIWSRLHPKGNNTNNIEITSTSVFFGPHVLYVLDRIDDKVKVSTKGGRGVNIVRQPQAHIKITKHN